MLKWAEMQPTWNDLIPNIDSAHVLLLCALTYSLILQVYHAKIPPKIFQNIHRHCANRIELRAMPLVEYTRIRTHNHIRDSTLCGNFCRMRTRIRIMKDSYLLPQKVVNKFSAQRVLYTCTHTQTNKHKNECRCIKVYSTEGFISAFYIKFECMEWFGDGAMSHVAEQSCYQYEFISLQAIVEFTFQRTNTHTRARK